MGTLCFSLFFRTKLTRLFLRNNTHADRFWQRVADGFCRDVDLPAFERAGKKKQPIHSLTESNVSIKLLQTGEAWSQWRGAFGDGHGSGLPSTWTKPKRLWRHPCQAQGIGGVAATPDFVIVSSRDANDKSDLFEVLDVESGIALFKLSYPAASELDYGNSPRVTPIIFDSYAYCLGAQGQLHCLDLETGKVVWKQHLVDDLGGKLPQWGFAVSPVLLDNQLIVQPGGLEAAWVALNPKTGKTLWRTKGRPSAYASPIAIECRGQKQIVGYDAVSLGGWSATDGKRLWEMKPEFPKDFNVPTPVLIQDKIIVVTENNGARVYSLSPTQGDYDYALQLEASSDALSGDSHSPVRVGKWVAGIDRDLVVLDPLDQLKEVARFSDVALQKYCSLMVDEDRVWVCTGSGLQILVQIQSNGISEIGRFQALEGPGEIFSHPALHNGILYLRGPTWLDAYELGGNNGR